MDKSDKPQQQSASENDLHKIEREDANVETGKKLFSEKHHRSIVFQGVPKLPKKIRKQRRKHRWKQFFEEVNPVVISSSIK